ncbi:MuDRA-like transposase [Cucumis melo var. makuwa]|uniref:MuDRA-like transposase n=1 Tax=Cucumis melo var. makuwa TaxID=1194695 RepID=A0A5D3DIG1_CUCMM|nr:MuDRA-like transposase [Cucumis melo var. makuwa]
MTHVRILVHYGGAWDEGRRKCEGGVLKGIVVSKEITHKDLQDELYDLVEVDSTKFDIKIRCIYEIKGEKEAPPFELSNDRDLKFYILSENPLEVPLYLSFEPTSNQSKKVLNKYYNSVSGSNQVQNLNLHPPIGMDTLHDNEVDIGEVQVGLCDNMIGTWPQETVWAYEVLSTASEHLATRNSKGLIPRILRWNCTQAPFYKVLQKNIFNNKNLSTQQKAFMESRIRGDDNMQMEDDESVRNINNNDTNTLDHAMNNKSLEQSDSSPQLSPQREQSQTVADQSEMHPITNKKRCRSKKSNDKEQQSHSKSYKKLKKEIKEVRKDLSTLTSIVCRMDDTIRKKSLKLSEMKQMLERLVQESGSDISIDGRDTDLLMTIKDISDNLNAKSQKEKDLPVVITTLPLVSQPLALCEMAPLDQTVQIHEVPPSISIVNEESQLETTKQQVEIHKNDEAVTLVEKEPVIVPDKDEEQKSIKRRKLWRGDVNFVIGCINIKEHWLAIAADMRKCKIYVFNSMPNYVEQKLVDQAF